MSEKIHIKSKGTLEKWDASGLLKKVHMLRCAANRTAQRMLYTPRCSVFARLASEHF
jgi:hypothetical protein